MATPEDGSYVITGKVCPPKLPMQNLASDGWNSLSPVLLSSLFTKTPVPKNVTTSFNSICALSFQASVWLSTDELSSASVVGLPYFFCNFCDYDSDSKTRLLNHIACKHIFKCKLCDFISITRYKLVQHQIQHHLDAKEVQPVLCAEMVNLNMSLLYRCSQNLSQLENDANTSTSLSSRSDEAVPVISLKINPSQEVNVEPEVLNNKLKCQIKFENPVSSSKCTRPSTGIIPSRNDDSLSESDSPALSGVNETGGSFKRCSSFVELSDSELSKKKFKISDTKFDYEDASNQKSSSHIPHFLDESDPNVTSSCSPYRNTPAELFEGRKAENNSLKKIQSKALSTNSSSQVLSFLMEPVGSSASVDSVKSETSCDNNSKTKISKLQKILQRCDNEDNSFYCKRLSDIPDQRSDYSKDVKPTIFAALIDSLDEHKGTWHQGIPSADNVPRQRSLSDVSLCEISLGNDLRNRRRTSKHSGLQINNSQTVENFLAIPGSIAGKTKVTGKEVFSNGAATEHDCKNDFKECYRTERQSSCEVGEQYDLLRRLLVGTAREKELVNTPAANTAVVAGKQSVASGSKDIPPYDCCEVGDERYELRSCAKSVTRASDMSLKDLLTQGLDGLPLSMKCSLCNFRSSSQTSFQKHPEQCVGREDDKILETQTHSFGLSNWVQPLTDCSSANNSKEMKIPKSSSVKCLSTEKCLASEVLKGLSEHYSRGGNSLQGKPLLSGDIVMNRTSSSVRVLAFSEKEIGELSDRLDTVSEKLKNEKTGSKKKYDSDSSYEPSNCSSSYNSDSDDKSSQTRKTGQRCKTRQKKAKNLTPEKVNDSESSTVPYGLDQSILLKKESEIHKMCLYCDFSTLSGMKMRQHLISSHPDCAPFSQVLSQLTGKSQFYYCRGAHDTCTFISCKAVRIFEHIKSCYSGYLDNFTYDDNEMNVDYSSVLLSLGIVSTMIDQSNIILHCLRCTFFGPDFHKVADHIAENHASYVSGVLSVNKMIKEPKVTMVCLLCRGHVPVNLWASHACRKLSTFRHKAFTGALSNVSPNLKLVTPLREFSNQNSYQEEIPERLLNRYSAGENSFELEEDYKPDIQKLNISSADSILNHTRDAENSEMLDRKQSNIYESVTVKQEIPDINSMEHKELDYDDREEFLDNIPVHFSQFGVRQTDSVQNRFRWKDNETCSSTSSSQTFIRKTSSGSSVLQSLLIGPQNRLTATNFSLLHTLLKPIPTDREQVHPKPLSVGFETPLQNSKTQSKHLPVLLAETPMTLNTNSQYPCILEMLSRQGCSAPDAFSADSISIDPIAGGPMQETGVVSIDPKAGKSLKGKSVNHIQYPVNSQAVTKYPPNITTAVQSKTSSAPTSEHPLSQTPQTPPLPALLIHSPSSSVMPTDTQDVPGPFTNLLRLLSKSKVKPDLPEEPMV